MLCKSLGYQSLFWSPGVSRRLVTLSLRGQDASPLDETWSGLRQKSVTKKTAVEVPMETRAGKYERGQEQGQQGEATRPVHISALGTESLIRRQLWLLQPCFSSH